MSQVEVIVTGEVETRVVEVRVPSGVGPAGADGDPGEQGEPGEGVPVGGTTGQVLAKIDNTNYNTEWISLTEVIDINVSDAEYDATAWNADLDAPSKNAVRDKFESVVASIPTQYTDEMARDAVGAALVGGTNITVTVNDGANTITVDGGVVDFLDLADAPTTYTGKGGYILRVNDDETAIELLPPGMATPPAPGETPNDDGTAITYASAAKWRVRTITPGSGGGVCWGEIVLCDQNLAPQAVTSTDKSTEDATFTAAKAFDGSQAVGNGWKPSAGNEANSWVAGQMAAPHEIRYIKLRISPGLYASAPTSFAFDYWNGAQWINVGIYNYAWGASDNVVGFYVGVDPGSTPVVSDPGVAYQPLDSDLTAIAALSTTAYGRAFLALADKAAAQSTIGIVICADQAAYDGLGSWDSTTIYLVKE